GAAWSIKAPTGEVINSGQILEIVPHKRMVLTWRKEFTPELHEEGYSRLTYDLEPQEGAVKLTITHEMDKPDSKLIQAVSGGWPLVLASLKSLLETGESLESTRQWRFGKTETR